MTASKEAIEIRLSKLEQQITVGLFDLRQMLNDFYEEGEEPSFDCWFNPETGCTQSNSAVQKMNRMCESLGFIPVPRLAGRNTFVHLMYGVLDCIATTKGSSLEEALDDIKRCVLAVQEERSLPLSKLLTGDTSEQEQHNERK